MALGIRFIFYCIMGNDQDISRRPLKSSICTAVSVKYQENKPYLEMIRGDVAVGGTGNVWVK